MANLHHKPIKRFSLNGNIHDDSAIARLKTEYIRLVTSEMRLSGYALRLDIDPDFTIRYNEEQEIFEFRLSMYGTYVGREQSKWITGIDGTQVIRTQKNKLNESLSDRESQSNQK
jgi:hypothetical protein